MKSFSSMLTDGDAYADSLPYERFLKSGSESLTDAELLAVIIRTGSRTASPVDIAHSVMALGKGKEKGLNSLFTLSLDELKRVNGIGEVKAVMLKCVAELSKRMAHQRADTGLSCCSSSEIASHYMELLRHEEREKVILLCLNNRLRLINEEELSIGTADSAPLSSRDVFRHALKCGATNIILLHNHPGGDPTPSDADIKTTDKIRKSGVLLDIYLRDHIIIGDKTYYSFCEKGLLWQ